MASSEHTASAHSNADAHSTTDATTNADANAASGTNERLSWSRDQTRADAASGPVAATPLEACIISCLANAQYHASREAFLDTVHRWFMFLVIALGAAALTDVLPRLLHSVLGIPAEATAIKEICAASSAILAALDLTFDLSNRARAHAMMRRRYFELLADLREGTKAADHVRACLERFSADEEPVYRVLYLACWNSAQASVFGRRATQFRISFLGNMFKNWLRRPAVIYPVIEVPR